MSYSWKDLGSVQDAVDWTDAEPNLELWVRHCRFRKQRSRYDGGGDDLQLYENVVFQIFVYEIGFVFDSFLYYSLEIVIIGLVSYYMYLLSHIRKQNM